MKHFITVTLGVIRTIVTWFSVIGAVSWIFIFFVPKLFGYYPYVVLSGSMEPTVHTGSLAYVDLFEEGEEPISEAVHAYRTADGEMVLHRLMGMSDTGYVFKGDANETYDLHTVQEKDIAGLYVTSIPKLGYAAAWVSSHGVGIGPAKIPAVVLFLAGIVLILNVACGILEGGEEEDEEDEDDAFVRVHVSHSTDPK